MCFNNLVSRNIGNSLKSVNILCVASMKNIVAMEECNEAMRDGRAKATWIELVSKSVEGKRVFFKEANVKYSFWMW